MTPKWQDRLAFQRQWSVLFGGGRGYQDSLSQSVAKNAKQNPTRAAYVKPVIVGNGEPRNETDTPMLTIVLWCCLACRRVYLYEVKDAGCAA
jgi:hypothetical protein